MKWLVYSWASLEALVKIGLAVILVGKFDDAFQSVAIDMLIII